MVALDRSPAPAYTAGSIEKVWQMSDVRAKLEKSGRIVLPAQFRRAIGVEAGDEVVLRLEGDEVRVLSPRTALGRAKAAVQRYSGRQRLTGRLIAMRRAEAKRG